MKNAGPQFNFFNLIINTLKLRRPFLDFNKILLLIFYSYHCPGLFTFQITFSFQILHYWIESSPWSLWPLSHVTLSMVSIYQYNCRIIFKIFIRSLAFNNCLLNHVLQIILLGESLIYVQNLLISIFFFFSYE